MGSLPGQRFRPACVAAAGPARGQDAHVECLSECTIRRLILGKTTDYIRMPFALRDMYASAWIGYHLKRWGSTPQNPRQRPPFPQRLKTAFQHVPIIRPQSATFGISFGFDSNRENLAHYASDSSTVITPSFAERVLSSQQPNRELETSFSTRPTRAGSV